MSWIIDDWRLKLLALALALLMLGAVAFSQNPPTTRTLSLTLHYSTVGPTNNLVIINPPPSVSVTFSGLADVIGNATPDNFTASVDALHATVGNAVKLNISVTSTLAVSIQNPAPIVVRVDTLTNPPYEVPVKVLAHGASGWSVTTTSATPPTVHFIGPQSWTTNLTASVVINQAISADHQSLRNLPIQFSNSNGALPLTPCTTQPCATFDVTSADVTINAVTGSTSLTVPLVADVPTNPPPAGYEITGVKIDPATVVVTGDPAALAKIQRIILPGVDLSQYTSTVTIQVSIPYPSGVTPLNPTPIAKVTYTIQKNPAVTASPSPSP